MRFTILGPLSVHDDTGRLVTPKPPKLRALLALLLVNKGQAVVADHLVNQLWDADPPRTARTALQVYISRLRQHMKEVQGNSKREFLVTEPSGYSLDLDGHSLDVDRFERLYEQASDAKATGELHRAFSLLDHALATWSGPVLADVRGVRVLARYAQLLEEKRLAVQEQCITIGLALGRHSQLIGTIADLTTQYPLREDLYGHLMLALYRSGRTAESLMTYQRIRQALIDELGMEPGARLKSLHQSILGRDPALEDWEGTWRLAVPPAPVAPPAPLRASEPPPAFGIGDNVARRVG